MDVKLIEVEVQRLAPKPGEVLMFRLKERHRPEAMHRFSDLLREIFPSNKVLLVDEGIEVSVIAAGTRE